MPQGPDVYVRRACGVRRKFLQEQTGPGDQPVFAESAASFPLGVVAALVARDLIGWSSLYGCALVLADGREVGRVARGSLRLSAAWVAEWYAAPRVHVPPSPPPENELDDQAE